MLRRTLILGIVLCLPVIAQAKPPELASVVTSPAPVGTAQLEVMWMDIYHASFWSDSGNWKATPYALSLTYDMGFSASELAERTATEMQGVSSLSQAACAHYAAQLKTLWPDVQKGDRITALAQGNDTVFFHNGRKLGHLAGTEFMQAFFGIWLSPQSSQPAMRRQLLGSLSP